MERNFQNNILKSYPNQCNSLEIFNNFPSRNDSTTYNNEKKVRRALNSKALNIKNDHEKLENQNPAYDLILTG